MKHLEIERKFLVNKPLWKALDKPAGIHYLQGYLSIDPNKVVRARVAGDRGYITIKGKSEACSRKEFEYIIPCEEAQELIRLFTHGQIEKVRFRIPSGIHTFEIDEFHGDNEGLMIAEIELENPDESFEKPDWLGEEVTYEERYYNSNLSVHPYNKWRK